jgi:sulfite reductase (ferredoxin)
MSMVRFFFQPFQGAAMSETREGIACLTEDVEYLAEQISEFKAGALSAAEFRAYRTMRGIYEHRTPGTYMVRARFAAGLISPEQSRALARAACCYGNGQLHLTTRQDVQVHGVVLDNLRHVVAELQAAGVLIRGGGGNALRNILACSDAGVCRHEAFDVSPYARAVTELLLRDPRSCQLPRKYKIAFSGCEWDCAGATVNDLGLIARVRDGLQGFSVYVGGGMGTMSRAADLLEPFVPAGEVHLVAEAVKHIFDRYGNRENRSKARLRFLLQQQGLPWFRERYNEEMATLRLSSPPLAIAAAPAAARCDASQPAAAGCDASLPAAAGCDASLPAAAGCDAGLPAASDDNFTRWQQLLAAPQRQPGYFRVTIPVFLGDISAGDVEALAGVAERYGEPMLRATQSQNLVLRWVAQDTLQDLYRDLAALNLAGVDAPILQNLVACIGPETCNFGACQSSDVARAIRQRLLSRSSDWNALGDFRIHISGCPNSCGRHPIADIGLYGVKRRVGDAVVPHYVLQVGGRLGEKQTHLAEGKQAVPAEHIPDLIIALLEAFLKSPTCPDFRAFLQQGGHGVIEGLLAGRGVGAAAE